MIKNILIEIEKQSNNHPDKSLRDFYKTLLKLEKEHPKVRGYLEKVIEKRTDIEHSHLVNLIYRAVQYTLIYKHSKKDMGNYTYEVWEIVLKNIFEIEKSYKTILEKTLKENTQTNIYQRYAGPKAVINKMFGNKEIAIVDLGCSQNLGLMGMELNHPFTTIKDHTKNKELSNLLKENININSAIGIDIENPYEKFEWALACRFYPYELEMFDEEEKMVKYLQANAKKTTFIQESILNINNLWEKEHLPKADVVIASVILYQLPNSLKEKALEEIHKILKEEGVLIINDFVKTNSHINWDVPWFENGKSNYRTVVLEKAKTGFSEPKEYIIWNNARCLEAYPGKDFHKL